MLRVGQRVHAKGYAMRILLQLATALLLGGFIGFSTTCSGLGLGGLYQPLAPDAPSTAPEAPIAPAEAALTLA